MTDPKGSSTRDRLLLAAAELLTASANREVSTRAICERAGVQAPTLYHHFGSKQGLLDAVVTQRFTEHMARGRRDGGDPVAAIRTHWDDHVRFGLEHPTFYVLAQGELRPGEPCSLTAAAEGMLVALLNEVAREGRLLLAPDVAARQLVAANVGATLSLISDPRPGWAEQLRDTLIASVVTDSHTDSDTDSDTDTGSARPGGSLSALAVGMLAALDTSPHTFTDGERTLLREWLHRAAG